MGEREAADFEIGEKRLDVAHRGLADGGVAHMPDGHVSGQAVDDGFRVELIADKAEAALGMELQAVEGNDARRLLAAMLKRVQPERGERRGVRMVEHPEYAALLV